MMHATRTLRLILIAGALLGAGYAPRRADRIGPPRGTAGPPRAEETTAGRAGRSPYAPPTFLDLIADGAIEVTARGTSTGLVRLVIRNREETSFWFVIPIGTFLDAGDAAFQSMITTHDRRVSLGAHESRSRTVRVACANLHRPGPRVGDTFQAVREAPDPRLPAALRSLDQVDASPAARQLAVWIMTDDAAWSGPEPSAPGEARMRRSTQDDAARALWALDRTGVDLASRAIWREAPEILAGVQDPALKAWLEARC